MFGGLAQLARAPGLQAGGQRFESVILHVRGGSGRILSLTFIRSLTYWHKQDCNNRSSDFEQQTES